MSRVAKNPIVLPKGVEATLGSNGITVKGAKGTLSAAIHPDVPVAVENGEIVVTMDKSNQKQVAGGNDPSQYRQYGQRCDHGI